MGLPLSLSLFLSLARFFSPSLSLPPSPHTHTDARTHASRELSRAFKTPGRRFRRRGRGGSNGGGRGDQSSDTDGAMGASLTFDSDQDPLLGFAGGGGGGGGGDGGRYDYPRESGDVTGSLGRFMALV